MFLQIGNLAVNVDKIEVVEFKETAVDIYTTNLEQAALTFTDGDAEAFKQWWEEKAEVYDAVGGNTPLSCPGCEAGARIGIEHLQECDKYVPF